MLLWIGGVILFRYLGTYGEGARRVLSFGWGELVCTVFTAIVFYVGIKTLLKSE